MHLDSTKRVKRFEPSTFTLATCKPTAAKHNDDNELALSKEAARSAYAARTTPGTTVSGFQSLTSGVDLEALETLIRAWPELPEAVKAGITAMIRATTKPPKNDR